VALITVIVNVWLTIVTPLASKALFTARIVSLSPVLNPTVVEIVTTPGLATVIEVEGIVDVTVNFFRRVQPDKKGLTIVVSLGSGILYLYLYHD